MLTPQHQEYFFFFIYLFFILRFGITAEQKGGETTTGKATKLLLAHSL